MGTYHYSMISTSNSFGIAVYENDRKLDEIGAISSRQELISNLVTLCNELQLDPVHLPDVVEDAVYEDSLET